MNKDRGYIIQGIFVLVSILFAYRLFSLQVLDDSYKAAADNNIIQAEIEYPFRGLVYDRNKELLVANKAMFDLLVIPNDLKHIDTLKFCNLVGVSLSDFEEKIKKSKSIFLCKGLYFYQTGFIRRFFKV